MIYFWLKKWNYFFFFFLVHYILFSLQLIIIFLFQLRNCLAILFQSYFSSWRAFLKAFITILFQLFPKGRVLICFVSAFFQCLPVKIVHSSFFSYNILCVQDHILSSFPKFKWNVLTLTSGRTFLRTREWPGVPFSASQLRAPSLLLWRVPNMVTSRLSGLSLLQKILLYSLLASGSRLSKYKMLYFAVIVISGFCFLWDLFLLPIWAFSSSYS